MTFLTIAKLRARCPIPDRPRRIPWREPPAAPEPWDIDDPQVVVEPLSPAPQQRTRPLTPLIKDLETRLAARAGLPRQKPTRPVKLGDASRVGDQADDQPLPQIPGEKMA